MSNDAAGDPHFALDRLVVRGRRVFGWGWVADRRRAVREVRLVFAGAGAPVQLAACIGLARKDVGRAFAQYVAADASGFVVTGYLPDEQARTVALEVAFEDGTAARFELGDAAQLSGPSREAIPVFRRLTRSAWRRLRSLDFSGLLAGRGGRRFGVRSLEDARAREELANALRAERIVRVVFDHSMGGGSNEYRRGTIARWLAASEAAVLVTYNLPTLDYRIHLFAPGRPDREFRAPSFLLLEAALQGAPVAELFVNSPVSFDEPALFAEWLARMRRDRPAMRLTVTVHDFFAVCPSFVLLDAQGRFCGVPGIRDCERCLERHQAPHVAFSPPSRIDEWRRAWGECVAVADEVRCFSESARRLLLRAYPALDRAATTVVPHRVEFSPARVPRVRHHAPLVVGVMGQINFQKGARIVTEIVERIERERRDVRIVVLGTLDATLASERLRVTGPYARVDLPQLVEKHAINMFLFPSIWPETFSYVVSEMMALRVPIVAFDLGAPAERLRGYPRGRLCTAVSAEAALEVLVTFHRELSSEEAAAA